MKILELGITLTLLIVLSGCSEFEDILGTRDALDLDVGDCYVEPDQLDLVDGEEIDLDFVEVVSCSEPHSSEVIAKYPSVPLAYRSLENPSDELCRNSMLNFVLSFHPNADESRTSKILDKFDDRFIYVVHFNYVLDSKEIDLDKDLACAIMSRDALSIGTSQNIIQNW
jgi:hypothetical protein